MSQNPNGSSPAQRALDSVLSDAASQFLQLIPRLKALKPHAHELAQKDRALLGLHISYMSRLLSLHFGEMGFTDIVGSSFQDVVAVIVNALLVHEQSCSDGNAEFANMQHALVETQAQTEAQVASLFGHVPPYIYVLASSINEVIMLAHPHRDSGFDDAGMVVPFDPSNN